jgi:predicted RNA-binding Zn-ribbon protein involved in translation (DUF1610 family)
MARYIKVVCPSCGHEWHEDLDQHQTQQIIYKGPQPKTKVETYRFKCPQDGTYVVVEVEIEE